MDKNKEIIHLKSISYIKLNSFDLYLIGETHTDDKSGKLDNQEFLTYICSKFDGIIFCENYESYWLPFIHSQKLLLKYNLDGKGGGNEDNKDSFMTKILADTVCSSSNKFHLLHTRSSFFNFLFQHNVMSARELYDFFSTFFFFDIYKDVYHSSFNWILKYIRYNFSDVKRYTNINPDFYLNTRGKDLLACLFRNYSTLYNKFDEIDFFKSCVKYLRQDGGVMTDKSLETLMMYTPILEFYFIVYLDFVTYHYAELKFKQIIIISGSYHSNLLVHLYDILHINSFYVIKYIYHHCKLHSNKKTLSYNEVEDFFKHTFLEKQ